MLPKKNRLSKSPELIKIKNSGKILQSRSFGVAFLERGDSLPSRFGFVVSAKISKKAIERNRIKRVLRESVGRLLEKVSPGFDILFLGKKNILGVEFDKISKEVRHSLKAGGLLK